MWLLLILIRAVSAVARRVDRALADIGTDVHDPDDCDACHAANDRVMERFDLHLWAAEMQEGADS